MPCGCTESLILGQSISWPIHIPDVNLATLEGQFKAHITDGEGNFVDQFSFELLDQILNKGKALMVLNTKPWLMDERALLAGQTVKFDVIYEIQPNASYPDGYVFPVVPCFYLEVKASPTLSTTAPL